MKNKDFASVDWGRKLEHHFLNANSWWCNHSSKGFILDEKRHYKEYYPAIDLGLIYSKLEELSSKTKHSKNYWVFYLSAGKTVNIAGFEHISGQIHGFTDKSPIIVLCELLAWLDKRGKINDT